MIYLEGYRYTSLSFTEDLYTFFVTYILNAYVKAFSVFFLAFFELFHFKSYLPFQQEEALNVEYLFQKAGSL